MTMGMRRPRMSMMGGQRQVPQANPAAFNRLARLQRQQVGAIAYSSAVAGKFLELPNVGYLYRVMLQFDLDMGTSIGGPAGRFLSGGFGDNTVRFPCPTNIATRVQFTLNVSSPIYSSDGYGNYILQLIQSRGANPWIQNATADKGRNRKERSLFAIFNATTGALVTPDSLVAAATNYKLRGLYYIPITLGESATAGLIPVQDVRISPQVILDLGDLTSVVTTPADFGATNPLAGNFSVFVDYFTVPDESIRPDTDYVMQTRQDIVSMSGVGENVYRPQIGGIILRAVLTMWNGSKAMDVPNLDSFRLRIQQGITLEKRTPQTFIADERRWYTKELPDEVYTFDHIAGFGDPTLPSLRDRVASNQLTRLEYISDVNAAVTLSATSEMRNYLQQLVPMPRV